NGAPAVVERALRLVARGALDDAGVDALAARVGMGARHLRRLFVRHLGAGPLAVARTERVHFARRLLDQTDLPVTRVALAAGFGSLRQFNRAFHRTFRRPPTLVRRRPGVANDGRGAFSLRLAYRPPLDWASLLAFLGARAIPGVEHADGTTYRRTIAVGEQAGTLAVCAERETLQLDVTLPGSSALFHVVTRVRRMLDLDADPARIAGELGSDPLLARSVALRPGLRIPGAWDPFECAVRAVVGQQVSVRTATTLVGRIADAFGRRVASDHPALTHVFPTPAVLADAPLERIGILGARARAIRALAAAVASGTLVLDGTASADETAARLAALPGIGEWTTQYVLLRALGEPDAFPAGDLALRRAAGNGAGALSARALAARAESWRPWRGYAAVHLWTKGERP
ncbi:MAG TPA: DNA-3-methyladenine glycosylase 2, partial [Candidatus Limnocylindria bacterium]|nr:DNA-3-methyladenine glycosylase 2 [Candidatus Limnocylindria bacterium]